MSRAIDMLITYRVVKLLVTPFEKTEAFKRGIIDKDGKNLIPMKKVQGTDKKHYTILHRFVFNLKKIMNRVGLGSRLASFGVALALLLKEDKNYIQFKDSIEKGVISYLKEQNLFDEMLSECREIKEENISKEPFITAFGFDVYEKDEGMIAEGIYAKTL